MATNQDLLPAPCGADAVGALPPVAGGCAEREVPRPPTPAAGWFGPPALRAVFGRGRESRKSRLRWLAALADGLKRLNCGVWEVAGNVVLPDGRRVAEAAQDRTFAHVPDQIKRAGRSTRDRDLLLREAYQRDCALQLARPDLPPNTDPFFAELRRLYGGWAAEHHVSLKLKAVVRRRRRVERGEALDRRFHSGRRSRSRDERLVDCVLAVYLHQNRFSMADADREQQRLAAELGIPALSRDLVRAVIAEIPPAARSAARDKERVFEARHVPKIRIDYTQVAAGDWLCLDGRVADVQVRTPAADGGWKAVRPVVLGILDCRSTLLSATLARTENSVAILRGLHFWVSRYGLPSDLTRDQGEAYKRAGRGAASDDLALADVFSRFGVRVHGTIPYRAWAKKIESIWRIFANHCDHWYRSYWGGRPEHRPEVAEELRAHHVEELSTWDDFAADLESALESYNHTPRRALAGLSPAGMFARFRGVERRIDPAVLDTYFTVARGPHRVRRDGVVLDGILYRLPAVDLVRLQGRKVWLLPSLSSAGLVAVVDKDEKLLAHGRQEQLIAAGATDEHAREAHAEAARVRRLAQAYLPQRDFLLTTPTGRILRARARAAAATDRVPPLRAPAVTIVRPDLSGQRKLAGSAAPVAGAAPTADREDALRPIPGAHEQLANLAGAVSSPRVPGPRFADLLAIPAGLEADPGPSYAKLVAEPRATENNPRPSYARFSEAG